MHDAGGPLIKSSDGGYVIAGWTSSNNGNVTGNHGGGDIWIVKLNNAGALTWQRTLGGSGAEIGASIQQTSDDGYIISGKTNSNNGDVTGFHGYNDFWLVKLAPESVGTAEAPNTIETALEIYPNPVQQSVSLKIAADETNLNITIYDLFGREMSNKDIHNGGKIDLSMLAKGLYLVVARTTLGEAFSGKLVKE